MLTADLVGFIVLAQASVALVLALVINAYDIRRWFVRLLWGSDRVAAWMAPKLRAGARCFACARRLDENERTYYGTRCERCEGRAAQALDEHTRASQEFQDL